MLNFVFHLHTDLATARLPTSHKPEQTCLLHNCCCGIRSQFSFEIVICSFTFVSVKVGDLNHASTFLQAFEGKAISGSARASSVPGHPYLPFLYKRRGEILVPHQRRSHGRGALFLGCEGCRWDPACLWLKVLREGVSPVSSSGITPVCHGLLTLFNPLSSYWYSPNHVFTTEVQSNLILHYRMRFIHLLFDTIQDKIKWVCPHCLYVVFKPRYYFRNWWNSKPNEPPVSRYPLKSKTEEEALPLYDGRALDYLFSQVSIQHCLFLKFL